MPYHKKKIVKKSSGSQTGMPKLPRRKRMSKKKGSK